MQGIVQVTAGLSAAGVANYVEGVVKCICTLSSAHCWFRYGCTGENNCSAFQFMFVDPWWPCVRHSRGLLLIGYAFYSGLGFS